MSFLQVLSTLENYGLKDDASQLFSENKKLWSSFITDKNFHLMPLFMAKEMFESDELTVKEDVLWNNAVKWAKCQFERVHSLGEGLGDAKEREEGLLPATSLVYWVYSLVLYRRRIVPIATSIIIHELEHFHLSKRRQKSKRCQKTFGGRERGKRGGKRLREK